MRRTAIAAAWLLGATVPLLAAVVFLFGCCALPFHHVIHKAMPFCEVAVHVLTGARHDHHDPVPAPEKQEPVKRFATSMPRAVSWMPMRSSQRAAIAHAATSYRSFITLGAVRCDRDVGLHLLVATLLI